MVSAGGILLSVVALILLLTPVNGINAPITLFLWFLVFLGMSVVSFNHIFAFIVPPPSPSQSSDRNADITLNKV